MYPGSPEEEKNGSRKTSSYRKTGKGVVRCRLYQRNTICRLALKRGNGKKANGKCRMCTDYTDLNKACPKDPFPLPYIDKLVDNSAGYKYLSFMDAYSGYNQIPMHPEDQEKRHS
jgi:hypothetical protein